MRSAIDYSVDFPHPVYWHSFMACHLIVTAAVHMSFRIQLTQLGFWFFIQVSDQYLHGPRMWSSAKNFTII